MQILEKLLCLMKVIWTIRNIKNGNQKLFSLKILKLQSLMINQKFFIILITFIKINGLLIKKRKLLKTF